MSNITKTYTVKQLIAEFRDLPVTDEAPVLINIGQKNYPIQLAISGSGNVYLEAGAQIGRPPKYATDEERRAARLRSNAAYNAKRRTRQILCAVCDRK